MFAVAICAERGQLIERINLFADYCRELECWEAPRRFESDHHRFMYCVGREALEYVPFDDTWGEVVLMSGLPGSGKSTPRPADWPTRAGR